MFGFWSFLPLSTSDTVYYNGRDWDFILYIQQQDPSQRYICSTISIDMELQKNEIFTL